MSSQSVLRSQLANLLAREDCIISEIQRTVTGSEILEQLTLTVRSMSGGRGLRLILSEPDHQLELTGGHAVDPDLLGGRLLLSPEEALDLRPGRPAAIRVAAEGQHLSLICRDVALEGVPQELEPSCPVCAERVRFELRGPARQAMIVVGDSLVEAGPPAIASPQLYCSRCGSPCDLFATGCS